MNIYVETNFVFELVFEQEEHQECEQILSICESRSANLIMPAYCLAEPHEKLIRQARKRRDLKQNLDEELSQLVRTGSYAARVESIRDIARLLVQSNEEEKQRFVYFRDILMNVVQIIPLTIDILRDAATYEIPYDLTPQDAIVYASVVQHLR
ncbi:MAG: hypothetical protein OHK0022_04260 [Roseiflexaceae bacterium]